MRIIRAKDYEDMSKKAASLIGAQILQKPGSLLGLATGSTPEGTYRILVRWHEMGYLDFKEVRSVNLDEYVGVEKENPQSYFYFMKHHLFDFVNIKPENIHLPNGMAGDIDGECKRYEALLRRFGGVDLQLLGIGHNGHIGFNEPGELFEKETHCVRLSESTIGANQRFFASEKEVPRQAISMGIGSIMQAKCILLIASGEAKAQILAEAVTRAITPKVPASVLQLHRNVILVGDEAALSKL